MADYYVTEKQPCPECAGRGWRRRGSAENEAFFLICGTICMACDGTGTRTREVPLAEALAALAGPGKPWREWAHDTPGVLSQGRVEETP